MPTPTPNDQDIRPPWWLKPTNKVFTAMMRVGLPISGKEGPALHTVAGRCAVFRFDPVNP